MATRPPPVHSSLPKPRFSLGGQVSSYKQLSTSDITASVENSDKASKAHQRHSMSSLIFADPAVMELPPDVDGCYSNQIFAKSMNPELALIREFTHDEQENIKEYTTTSPSSMFKSSFAKEVVHNVRKSMTNGNNRTSLSSSFKSDFAAREELDDDLTCRSSTNQHKKSLLSEKDESDSDLWMSSTQFIELLDKQEAAEGAELSQSNSVDAKKKVFEETRSKQTIPEQNGKSKTRAPLSKLKKTYTDLGFMLSEKEWRQVREILQTKWDLRSEGEDSLRKNNNQKKYSGKDSDLVRNEDFFSAVHTVLKNGKSKMMTKEELLKESMKSFDGDLESCRSSDSGLENASTSSMGMLMSMSHHMNGKRGLTKQMEDMPQASGGVFMRMQRQMADKDVELNRLQEECKRLAEDNRSLREKLDKLRIYSNPKKHIALEHEIDQLKWQLSQMETSRKTYELATQRLVSFLDEVTSALQSVSPAHRRLVETTKAEVSRVARRTKGLSNSSKRLSLDAAIMARAESMPGLNLEVPSTNVGSLSSISSSNLDSVSVRRVQRSQSTSSKRSALPSLQEQEDQVQPYENHSVIEMAKEEIREETEQELAESKTDENEGKYVTNKTEIITSERKCKNEGNRDEKSDKTELLTNKEEKDTDIDEKDVLIEPAKRSKSMEKVKKRHSLLGSRSKPNDKSILSDDDRDSGRCSTSSGRSTPIQGQMRRGSNISNKLLPKLTPSKSVPSVIDANDDDVNAIQVVKDKSKKDSKLGSKERFKSLGNIQIEPALPATPIGFDVDERSTEPILTKSQKMLRSMRSLLAREKTLTITPKKSGSHRRHSDKPPQLQLLSHSLYPGLPSFPVVASMSTQASPWRC